MGRVDVETSNLFFRVVVFQNTPIKFAKMRAARIFSLYFGVAVAVALKLSSNGKIVDDSR